MKTIDQDIRFHLAKSGWYLGDTKINMVEDSIKELDIDANVHFISGAIEGGDYLSWAKNGEIYMRNELREIASAMQIKFLALHEYAHILLVGSGYTNHQKELKCDLWAFNELKRSGKYNRHELLDAINTFMDVIVNRETPTHPSSKERYERLRERL